MLPAGRGKAEEKASSRHCIVRGLRQQSYVIFEKKGATANGISMILSTERSGCKASQAADMLTVLLGKHLQPSPGSPYLIEREPHCFQFTEEPKYVALTGVSRAVKEGEKISGDQYAMLESEKGRLLLLLSDGTGAGEDASRGSGRVLDLMEKMLEAGFDTEESVNMLNSALYAQNEEEDHPTVDICRPGSVQRRVRDLQSRRCGHFSERKWRDRVYRRRKSAAGDFPESADGSPGAAAGSG